MADILVVDDDESIATAFQHFLRHEGHAFRLASNAGDAARLIAERRPNLVFMDVRMPGIDGLQALEQFRGEFPDVYVVMMTAYGTSQTSIDAIRAGAFDYLIKPLDLDQLRSVIVKALSAQHTIETAPGSETTETSSTSSGPVLVGKTPAMLEVYKLIGRLATNDVPALIAGERGTGKQLVIATIHDNSARHAAPFVPLDCATASGPALEAELFQRQIGTVHLAGIEALALEVQSRLARALADRQSRADPSVPRLGARVLASTERDLAESVRTGTFSRELYDAIAVITLKLPLLRERREDIPLLIKYFIQRFNVELNRAIKGVDDSVAHVLQMHAWPGNIGELERVVKRACIVARSDVITVEDLGDSLSDEGFPGGERAESGLRRAVRTALHERLVEHADAPSASAFHDIVDLVEVTLVTEALTITNGNQVKAADILGVNRATLRKKIPSEE